MSTQLLRNICNNSIVNNLSKDALLLHSGMWADTIKDGEWVYKFYRYKNENKIKQEVELLKLMKQFPVELFRDEKSRLCSKTPYLSVESINEGSSCNWLYSELSSVFDRWKDEKKFYEIVNKSWESEMKPYMVKIIEKYLPQYTHITEYLHKLKASQFIHGDFTLSNVMKCEEKIIVFDFEMANIGPEKWDETSFIYSLFEHQQYELGEKLFRKFECSSEMLFCIAVARLATAYKKEVNVKRRKQTLNYIKRRKNDEKDV